MSKGHAGAGLYATLAECGFFPIQRLDTHCQNGSNLCGHVATHGIPGIEFSTGSQFFSPAVWYRYSKAYPRSIQTTKGDFVQFH
jgi:transketolase